MSSLKSRMMLQSPAKRSPRETGRESRCAPSVAPVLHYGSCLDPGVAAKAPPLGTVTSSTSVAEQPPSRGTEPGGGARLAQIRWDRWFLVLGIPFGLLLMVFLKPNLSPDAPFHFLRIDQIAHGHVVSPRDRAGQAIASPDACAAGVFTSLFSQWLEQGWHPSDAFRTPPCKARPPIVMNNTAVNSPVAYLPEVVGYGVGRIVSGALLGVWLARLAGLAAYLAVCWLALRIAPSGRPLLFFVALTPTSMTLAANLSADPMAISFALLVVATVLRLRQPLDTDADAHTHTGRLLATLAVSLVLLGLSKDLYWPFALVLLLVPAERFRTAAKRVAYIAATVGCLALAVGYWTTQVVSRIRFIIFWNGVDSFKQRDWIRAHPGGYLKIVGNSLLGTPLLLNHTIPGTVAPSWWLLRPRQHSVGESIGSLTITVIVFALALLAGLASDAMRGARTSAADARSERRQSWVAWGAVAIIGLVVSALIVYGESLVSTDDLWLNPKITYIEGRFFLPILPLVLLPLAARGRLLDGATTRAWAWALPVSLVVLTGWTVARFGQLSF
jgi:hypothetical protein